MGILNTITKALGLDNTKKTPKEPTKIPKTVQDSIPYLGAYENGIIQVSARGYSKMYALSDINFSIESMEEQRAIFGKYSEFIGREMSIMSLRYGINTDEPMTLRKIGEQFGVQQQRIRQILAKCLHKLRNPANSQLLLPNYQRYAKALQSCQEVQAVSDNLEKAYERTVEKYTWLLHKKELVDKAPEIRRQLENMIQISDMVIPENWKEILKSKGIITVFDYLEADHAELEKTKEFCPDFSCSVLDTMFGVPTQEVKSIAASAIRISTLNLSTRTYKALLCAGIITLGDLTKKSRKEIMEIRNFGRSCYEELETILSKYNISLMED